MVVGHPELIVGGVGVVFGYTTLGATLDITPPLTTEGSIVGDACLPLGGIDATGKVFVHNGELRVVVGVD